LTVRSLFARFVRDETGATAVEYALLASLIAIAIIGGATALGSALNTKFNDIATSLN
jgi:pilus assembly protein Flp/PilA